MTTEEFFKERRQDLTSLAKKHMYDLQTLSKHIESFAPEERVDLVKMDVEGAEPLVWRGMQRVLRENAGIEIILEWSSSHFRRAGEDPVAFMAEIRAAGFNPFVISDNGSPSHLAPLSDGVDALEATNLLLTRRPIDQNTDHVLNLDRVQTARLGVLTGSHS